MNNYFKEEKIVYANYVCPFCNKLLYKKYYNCNFAAHTIQYNKYDFMSDKKTHECVGNMTDVEQKVFFRCSSISKYRLPFSEEILT